MKIKKVKDVFMREVIDSEKKKKNKRKKHINVC